MNHTSVQSVDQEQLSSAHKKIVSDDARAPLARRESMSCFPMPTRRKPTWRGREWGFRSVDHAEYIQICGGSLLWN